MFCDWLLHRIVSRSGLALQENSVYVAHLGLQTILSSETDQQCRRTAASLWRSYLVLSLTIVLPTPHNWLLPHICQSMSCACLVVCSESASYDDIELGLACTRGMPSWTSSLCVKVLHCRKDRICLFWPILPSSGISSESLIHRCFDLPPEQLYRCPASSCWDSYSGTSSSFCWSCSLTLYLWLDHRRFLIYLSSDLMHCEQFLHY